MFLRPQPEAGERLSKEPSKAGASLVTAQFDFRHSTRKRPPRLPGTAAFVGAGGAN